MHIKKYTSHYTYKMQKYVYDMPLYTYCYPESRLESLALDFDSRTQSLIRRHQVFQTWARVYTHRLLSSSFLGLPFWILNTNPIKELLRSLWVGSLGRFKEFTEFQEFRVWRFGFRAFQGRTLRPTLTAPSTQSPQRLNSDQLPCRKYAKNGPAPLKNALILHTFGGPGKPQALNPKLLNPKP